MPPLNEREAQLFHFEDKSEQRGKIGAANCPGFANIKIFGNITEFPKITPEVFEEPQSGLHLYRYETVNKKRVVDLSGRYQAGKQRKKSSTRLLPYHLSIASDLGMLIKVNRW